MLAAGQTSAKPRPAKLHSCARVFLRVKSVSLTHVLMHGDARLRVANSSQTSELLATRRTEFCHVTCIRGFAVSGCLHRPHSLNRSSDSTYRHSEHAATIRHAACETSCWQTDWMISSEINLPGLATLLERQPVLNDSLARGPVTDSSRSRRAAWVLNLNKMNH